MATLQTQLLLATIVVFLLLPFTTAIWCTFVFYIISLISLARAPRPGPFEFHYFIGTFRSFLLFISPFIGASAKSFWQASDVESCDRQLILVDDGNGTLDLTGWTAGNFKKVFEDDEKFISGGIKIDNSTLATIEMALEPGT